MPRSGWRHSEETRRKISNSLIGNKRGRGNKGQVAWNKGFTKETDKRLAKSGIKISNANKGRPCSEETRQKISEAQKGKHTSPQTEFKKGHIPSEETRRKLRRASLGHRHSEETKRKISKAQIGVPRPHKGGPHSKEAREKHRKARLKQVFPQRETSIERALQDEFNYRGLAYQKHLPVCGICQPDIVFPELRIAVFADGDYWHSKDFKNGIVWDRDRHQDQVLRENGWTPLRFWGHEIREDAKGCVDKIVNRAQG